MKIALFFLVNEGGLGGGDGGNIAYTCHLVHALIQEGHSPRVIRITQRSEKKQRVFRPGIPYQNLSLSAARRLAQTMPSFVAYSIWKQYEEELTALMGVGTGVSIHGPAECKQEFYDAIQRAGIRPVGIRKSIRKKLIDAGLDAVYIPHPYVQGKHSHTPIHERERHAVCISRIDFVKHTDIIIEANGMLPRSKRVDIAGKESRRYGHFKLDQEYPGWREYCIGEFRSGFHSSAAVAIAGKYKFVVDMSKMVKDGGGTQYTFLEAWDAGCVLILNTGWTQKGKNEVKPDRHALFVEDAEELASALRGPIKTKLIRGGRSLLKKHSASAVVPRFIEYLKHTRTGK